jgi:hypothetical protein
MLVKSKSKILPEIKVEIANYNPPKRIADAMLSLGKMGFSFMGHGSGVSGEHWSLIKDTNIDEYCVCRDNSISV